MKITIYGAGAIGGSLGAFLVRAGEDVLFVDKNPEHVREINASGLQITGIRGEFVVKAKAVMPEELHNELEVVLLAVKAHHTEEAVRQILPLLNQKSMIAPMQSGISEIIISEIIGQEKTIGCMPNWAGDYIAPGHIQFGAEGSLTIGELDGKISARIKSLQKSISEFLPVQVARNIWSLLWSKQVYLPVLFATALTDLPIAEVVTSPDSGFIMGDLVREAMQVPDALQIPLHSFDEFDPSLFEQHQDEEAMEKIAAHFRGSMKPKTGVWRDIAVRKRPTEVDGVIGATVNKGEELGLSLPLNRRLVELIHELEDKKRPMDIGNLKELKADALR